MIIFDQLRISDNGQKMYINVHVNQADYFDNIYLDSLTVMTADKVSKVAPELVTEEFVYKKTFEGNLKQADLVLVPSDFNEKFTKNNFSSDLFFLYVKIKGVPDACTPCRLDEEITLGVTFDENLLYQRVMDYTKDLADDCTIPTGFTDFILLWNAFKSAVETEHYIPAVNYYNMLFDKTTGIGANINAKPCGCHG